MKHAATGGDDVQQDGLGGRKIRPEEPWPPPPARRATDHEGETLFGTDTRSRLRAVHSANLFHRERRLGFWVGAVVWVPTGALLVLGLLWVQEVFR